MKLTTKISKQNFADVAESKIKGYKAGTRRMVTTSQIRNMLSMITDLGEKSKKRTEDNLTLDELSALQYLKMRVAYDAGRDNKVRDFVEEAEILDQINAIEGSREALDVFYNYFEALVAYHRFHGGKD